MMLNENKVYIFDDIIPIGYQNHLYRVFSLGYIWSANGFLPFSSTDKYVQKNSNISNNLADSFQFQHPIWDEKPINQTYTEVLPILHYIQSYFNFSYNYNILSIKANLKTNNLKDINSDNFSPPHVDYEDFSPFLWTILYYVNDSDGDTIIFNEKYNGNSLKNYSINKKISPQKGRCVMFRTNTFHSSGIPIKNLGRIIINYNINIIPL